MVRIITSAALIMGAALASPLVGKEPIRINQVQVLGSHNSYRPVASVATQELLDAQIGAAARGLDYGHPTLEAQLDLGVRQFEFDPYVDRDGGLYSRPSEAAGPKAAAIMAQPGLKVLHMPVIDPESHCLTLKACFVAIAAWSRLHPTHEVIFITVDTKEAPSTIAGIASPELYQAQDLDEIDRTARAAFGASNLITPDTVRGRYKTLREAVLAKNWPTAASARGKIMIILDSNPRIADIYRSGHPALAGRAMFGVYLEDQPEASVFNIQDPIAEEARIVRLVGQGYIVRSRADANTIEARTHDLSRFQAAVRSGAQIISSDYYPGAPDPLGLKFEVRMSGGYGQRNPVTDQD
jgi:hypothetical protein